MLFSCMLPEETTANSGDLSDRTVPADPVVK